MTALPDKLNQIMSKNRFLSDLDREKNLSGKIQDFLNGKTTSLDTDLLNNFYLRMAVERAWGALQNPIRLNYDLSLLLNLEAVHIAPPERKGNTARLVIGLIARPKLVSGDIPRRSTQPLPIFSMVPGLAENGFHIALDNEISFDFVNKEFARNLEGKKFLINGKSITLDRIKLYGTGDLVILQVQVKGDARGTIYLTGTPVYDQSAMTIFVNNLDYTVETKNVLAKTADWLLHAGVRESLAEQAKWFIGDRIDMVKDRLSDALNRKVNRHIGISGKILRIRPVALGTTATSIRAVFIADGKVEINVL
jgi:hypothetical protein